MMELIKVLVLNFIKTTTCLDYKGHAIQIIIRKRELTKTQRNELCILSASILFPFPNEPSTMHYPFYKTNKKKF